MDANDSIRKMVSENYANAVARPTEGCGCGGAQREPQAKGLVAKLAGYREEELRKLPEDAVVNSFGCGNPVAFSEVAPGDVVLDLGSGAGLDLLIAAEKVGPSGRVIGVDMTDEMIARARANIAAAGLANVEVRKGIIEELPVETDSVDWVISNCVINLSPEKDRVFSEIARVLKPGGRMMVSDMVVQDMPEWVRKSAALYASCVAGAISEEAYLDGLRRAGLEQVEVTARMVYDASQLSSFVDSELGEEVVKVMSCCGGGAPSSRERLAEFAQGFEGKVWSAKFAARKPAA
jgi:arsenite methyltransferase